MMSARVSCWRRTFELAIAAIALSSLATSLACTHNVEIGTNEDTVRSLVLDSPARARDKLDLLFVVDNSSNMVARQKRLAAGFDEVVRSLRGDRDSTVDLHLAVVSSDLGAGRGAAEFTSCSEKGDDAAFLRGHECGIDGSFISHVESQAAGPSTNYSGELSSAFECLTALGETGCDFEQPFEAMRRALSNDIEARSGFLRSSAALGVIIVSDEDDCSARGDSIFGDADPMLGGDPEWRCFSQGVRCGVEDDVFPPGWQTDCVARETSAHVRGIGEYIDFLRRLKGDPAGIFVAAVVGDPDVIQVEPLPGQGLSLAPACSDPLGIEAFPGVRLRRFVDALGGDAALESGIASMCAGDEAGGILANAARRIRSELGTRCLRGNVVDVDGDAPGHQVDCRVSQVFADRAETIAACDDGFGPAESSVFPCYRVATDFETCSHEETSLALNVVRSPAPDQDPLDAPIDARLRASCVVRNGPLEPID